MPAGESARPPRIVPRVAVAELSLTAVELGACALPLVLWGRAAAQVSWMANVVVPVGVAVWVALALRLADLLRPVVAVARAKVRQETVAAPAAEAAQRALARIPGEGALARLVVWAAVLAAVVVHAVRSGRPPMTVAAIAATVLLHAMGAAALRAVVLERVLGELRPTVLANVEGMRVFSARYRAWLRLIGLATVAAVHAALAVVLVTAVPLSARERAASTLLLLPTLLIATPMWLASLARRTRPIEDFFDATLRAPGTRGPSRDEPRAVTAFTAAQSIPYRLGGYMALALALGGVGTVAASRVLLRLDVAEAARMLGALALLVLGTALYAPLLFRQALRPLMRHLGSRHYLPVAAIRSRVGLRAKLYGVAFGATALGAGFVALWAAVEPPRPAYATAVLVLGAAIVVGAVGLVVTEVVAPVQALESRSEELARGELARPVPPWGEADEIGRLSVAFEEMRRSLRDRLRSTESINIDLEREVRRRTEALEQRNAELRDALEKLRRAQDNLVRSEKLASMGRLVAGIAHEINNPVNAVINSLGPLEETIREIAADEHAPTELTRSAQDMLAVIQRGASRTKAIVQALHNYSRGDEAVQREVNLARSVDDTVDLLRHRLRNVTVTKEIDPAARIMGYPGQIDQVLMNLITNAAQALGDAGGTIKIAIAVRDGEVELTVADDGPGIPADVLPRIFDPFFTTKDVGEGSGLGLSIVHGIVERHGGHIDVDSAPGRGTIFTIKLPRARAGASTAA